MDNKRISLIAIGGLMTLVLSASWPLTVALALVFWLERKNQRAYIFVIIFALIAIVDFVFWVI